MWDVSLMIMIGSCVILAILYGSMVYIIKRREKRLELEKVKKAVGILTIEERANQPIGSDETISGVEEFPKEWLKKVGKAGRILTIEERTNQPVESGEIIVHRQEGIKFLRGENVAEKTDGSLCALTSGIVRFVLEERGDKEAIRVHVRTG